MRSDQPQRGIHNKLRGSKILADRAHAPGQDHDDQDGAHLLNTADEHVEGFLKAHQLLGRNHNHTYDRGQQITGGQSNADFGARNVLEREPPTDKHH